MKKGILSFAAVMLIIIFVGVSVVTGFYLPGGFVRPDGESTASSSAAGSSAAGESTGYMTLIPSIFDNENGIRLGLDLVGGSSITFEAQLPDGYDMSRLDSDMNSAVEILRYRLTSEGYTEAQVSQQGTDQIVVEIPQIKNPEEAVQVLGQTAQLSFQDADGTEWLTGSDIQSASSQYGSVGNSAMATYYVSLEFTREGREKFADATAAIAARTDDNSMYIILDGQIISYPTVSMQIDDDGCVIEGSFTEESARQLANLIGSGALPFSLEQVELRAVGPQLGADAMRTSALAGIIGVALVAVFMVIVYRLPGVVSVLALGFYIVIEALVLGLLHVNLSLPGIAGLILSIGMAVDANVIIFERIKEELRAGKTVRASIDAGFKRAFTAILDSNITTLIAAVVLYFFGSGTIVGFATTFGLGVIISMFTALTVTHFLLNRMVDFRIRNPKAYGA